MHGDWGRWDHIKTENVNFISCAEFYQLRMLASYALKLILRFGVFLLALDCERYCCSYSFNYWVTVLSEEKCFHWERLNRGVKKQEAEGFEFHMHFHQFQTLYSYELNCLAVWSGLFFLKKKKIIIKSIHIFVCCKLLSHPANTQVSIQYIMKNLLEVGDAWLSWISNILSW